MSSQVALLIEGAERPATQGRVTHRRPSPTRSRFLTKKKTADEELGNRRSEKARRLDVGDDEKTRDEGDALSHGGYGISRERGLSRRSNLNGPFGTGKAGWGEFNRINRIQLKAPSSARADYAAFRPEPRKT